MHTLTEPTRTTSATATRPGYFFVRGHPRSGTNWVSNLLNLHPAVSCTGEFHFETIYNAVHRTKSIPWQITGREPIRTELEDAFGDMVRRCVSRACRDHKPDAAWHGDRTPSDLLSWMSGARYIWVLRDGRDVAVSWTFHQLRKGREVIEASIPADASGHLLRLCDGFAEDPERFVREPELLLGDEAWVRHVAGTWDRRYRSDTGAVREIERPEFDGEVLAVRYEDLHADTEAQRDRMLEFLGLDPAQSESPSAETFTRAGYDSTDPTKYRRQGEVGDWKKYFTDQARAWYHDVAGDSLVRAGYAQDEHW
ncbi:MAG: sulfotransferase domain-containing protein [Phycisphaerales bacterium JB041]